MVKPNHDRPGGAYDTCKSGSIALFLDGDQPVHFRKFTERWWVRLGVRTGQRKFTMPMLLKQMHLVAIQENPYMNGPGRPSLQDTLPHFPKPTGPDLPLRDVVTLTDVARYYKISPLTVRRRFAAWGIPMDTETVVGRVLIERDVALNPLRYTRTEDPSAF